MITIPTGSEDTLIEELNKFNKEMYNNLPEHYIINYDNNVNIKNSSENIKKDYKKNILNLLNPFIQDSSIEFDEQEIKELVLYVEKTINNFEELFNNNSMSNDNKDYIINTEK